MIENISFQGSNSQLPLSDDQKKNEYEGFPEETTSKPEDAHSTNPGVEITELELEFIGRGEVRGVMFRQIHRSEKGYIYEVRQPDSPPHYEVFLRVLDKRFSRVAYPKSKSFGVTAWTLRNLEDAFKRFERSVEASGRTCHD